MRIYSTKQGEQLRKQRMAVERQADLLRLKQAKASQRAVLADIKAAGRAVRKGPIAPPANAARTAKATSDGTQVGGE